MRTYNAVLLIRMQGQRAVDKPGAHPALVLPPPFLTRAGSSCKQPHDREGHCSFLQAIYFCQAPRQCLQCLFLELPSAILLINTISKLAGTTAACALHPHRAGIPSVPVTLATAHPDCCVRPFCDPWGAENQPTCNTGFRSIQN